MLRHGGRGVDEQAVHKPQKRWISCSEGKEFKVRIKKKPPGLTPWRPCSGVRLAQAVSPYTETVMSTTTSVCKATLTVLSPTTLIGPFGMRI
jgi:hypothetical protein